MHTFYFKLITYASLEVFFDDCSLASPAVGMTSQNLHVLVQIQETTPDFDQKSQQHVKQYVETERTPTWLSD